MSKSKQETIADIVAEMRKDIAEGTVGIWSDFGGEIARGYADRIEAAYNFEREAVCENYSHVGNAEKMREALLEIQLACYKAGGAMGYDVACGIIKSKSHAALSSPPRNCDVGTAEEQERRWRSNCGSGIPNCKHCKVYEQARKSGFVDDKNMIRFDCRFIWSQMPYEEGCAE